MLALTSVCVASTDHIMYMHIIRKATTTLSIMIMTATMMPTADELPGSDDPSNSTITGDEKLPPPTEVTAWICKYEERVIPNLLPMASMYSCVHYYINIEMVRKAQHNTTE